MGKLILIAILPLVFLEAIWDVVKDIPRDLKYSLNVIGENGRNIGIQTEILVVI